MLGGDAARFICARHAEQAPEAPPSPLRPTKTVCVLVAATRAGPEFVKPGTPPTGIVEPVPLSGSMRYTLCAPKSATTSCEASGVRLRPRTAAVAGGPPGG